MIASTVTVPAGLFLAVVVFAAIGIGYVCTLIIDLAPPDDRPDPLWDDPVTEESVVTVVEPYRPHLYVLPAEREHRT